MGYPDGVEGIALGQALFRVRGLDPEPSHYHARDTVIWGLMGALLLVFPRRLERLCWGELVVERSGVKWLQTLFLMHHWRHRPTTAVRARATYDSSTCPPCMDLRDRVEVRANDDGSPCCRACLVYHGRANIDERAGCNVINLGCKHRSHGSESTC